MVSAATTHVASLPLSNQLHDRNRVELGPGPKHQLAGRDDLV